MSTFFSALGDYRGTFGATLNGQVQSERVLRQRAALQERARGVARRRRTSRPRSTRSLVDGVNQGLPTFHRYLQLRKKMMKLPDLHYYDLYAPLVASADLELHAGGSARRTSSPRSRRSVRTTSPRSRRAFNERWIDLMPTEGKKSGAYSNGARLRRPPLHADQLQRQVHRHEHGGARARAHDAELPVEQDAAVPPRELPDLRRRGRVDVQRGAAHRLHAEDDQGSDNTRLSLLGNYLENIKGTVFRQTQFAEFELRIHEMAEKGEPITGEALDKLYLDIVAQVLRPRQGRLPRRRLRRARVGVHPALLPRLLRLPVRDVVHRVGGARRRRCSPAIRRRRSAT